MSIVFKKNDTSFVKKQLREALENIKEIIATSNGSGLKSLLNNTKKKIKNSINSLKNISYQNYINKKYQNQKNQRNRLETIKYKQSLYNRQNQHNSPNVWETQNDRNLREFAMKHRKSVKNPNN